MISQDLSSKASEYNNAILLGAARRASTETRPDIDWIRRVPSRAILQRG